MSKTTARVRAAKQLSGGRCAPLDLTPFCDRTGRKAPLDKPWTEGGFTYATDMCIVLKVPARAGEQDAASPFTTSVEKLLAEHPAPSDKKFAPLPPLEGKTAALVVCRECRGTGAVLIEDDKPDLCPRCGGKKKVGNSKPVQVGRRRLATKYLFLLAKLPGVRIAAETGKPAHPMRFAFDGGEGLVMPLLPDPVQPESK